MRWRGATRLGHGKSRQICHGTGVRSTQLGACVALAIACFFLLICHVSDKTRNFIQYYIHASNLNHGQDTRANRTRHTTSSSTQPHAKQQLTNATRHTSRLTFTRTHTPAQGSTQNSLSHPHVRAHPPGEPSPARSPPTSPPAPPPAASPAAAPAGCRSRPTSSSWRRVRPTTLW